VFVSLGQGSVLAGNISLFNFEIGSGFCRHSFHPEHGSGKIDETGEVAGAFAVASRDSTIVLESVEEALDMVALGLSVPH
jgi:hypothetical protein